MKTLLEKYAPVFAPEGEAGGGGDAPAGNEGGGATTLLGSDLPKEPTTPTMADHIYGEDGVRTGGDDDKGKEEEEPKGGEEEKPKEKEEKADDDKKKDDDKKDGDEAPAIKPEDYELSVPEHFFMDEEIETEFRSMASERGWSKEDVQKLQSMQVKLYEKQATAHAEMVSKWGEDLKADKEIGGSEYDANAGRAIQTMHEFFSPEARELMDRTGMGNHPEIVKGFVRIGKLFGEGATMSGVGGSRSTIVGAMYGDDAG